MVLYVQKGVVRIRILEPGGGRPVMLSIPDGMRAASHRQSHAGFSPFGPPLSAQRFTLCMRNANIPKCFVCALTSKTCLLCHTSERIHPWFASTAMRHSIKKNHTLWLAGLGPLRVMDGQDGAHAHWHNNIMCQICPLK